MQKALIAYGTRRGATAETAKIIASILREEFALVVDEVDVKKEKEPINLDQYQNIIIGSSIAIGRWTKEAKRFLENDFADKQVFVFVLSGRAGKAIEENDMKKYQEFQKKYIDDTLAKYPHVKPVESKAFGGITFFHNWKREDVVSWAKEIGKRLVSE